jgi:hypothetical protein
MGCHNPGCPNGPNCPDRPIPGCDTGRTLSTLELAGVVLGTFPDGTLGTPFGTFTIREVAYGVARAESGRRPTACNWTYPPAICECSVGLYQVFLSCHPQYDPSSLLDPWYAARAARDLSASGRDWRAWTTYTGGSFVAYISEARTAITDFIRIYGHPPPPPTPGVIPDGTLATYDGSGGRVWIIFGGRRREIVMRVRPGDTFAACGYDFRRIRVFSQADVLAMPAGANILGPPDCPYGNPPVVLRSGGNEVIVVALFTGAALATAAALTHRKLV